ncbi:MAG: hypothetical protein ACQ9MH_24125 [Nitrospinales bacterium]
MESNSAFNEYNSTQKQIKQMCIEYVKTYFEPADTEALSQYLEENNHKLRFYIDEKGIPNFQDNWADRIFGVRFKED